MPISASGAAIACLVPTVRYHEVKRMLAQVRYPEVKAIRQYQDRTAKHEKSLQE